MKRERVYVVEKWWNTFQMWEAIEVREYCEDARAAAVIRFEQCPHTTHIVMPYERVAGARPLLRLKGVKSG